MKVALLSATALAAISTACAFAPSHQPRTRSSPGRTPGGTAVAALLPAAASDPYRNLPWNAERQEARAKSRLTKENAALFRELGLPQDATYEDVASKTEFLISLTEDLPKNEAIKKKIRIEISRDKIYQIRLNERISGVRAEQDDAARVSALEDDGLEGLMAITSSNVDDIVKPKQKLRIPIISPLAEYFVSIVVPPDEAWRKRQITAWGLSTLACLVVPTLTDGFARVNWLPAGGMMGYRGMPGMADVGSGYNPFRGKRNKSHQVKAMGIALVGWIFARSLAESIVGKVPALAASRSALWYKFAGTQLMMGSLVSYIQTYKEGEEGKELMI